MSQALSERTVTIVKATVPALEAHGLDIVREMYARMFQNPEIRDLFNQSHHGDSGSQPRALTGAILAYAANIDNLGALTAAVERIAQKHVGLQIMPDHYPHVASALLGAIGHVLGEAATEDVLTAWGEAYWFLANILITREAALYENLAAAEGGWNGWRAFEVAEVQPESSVITSIILRPVDGGPVLAHKPGQYLTFWLDLPGHSPIKRNYSISSAPNGETYRISVKREPHGLASTWLHENARPGRILKVGAPAGDFFLPEDPQRPIVLLSGGVGLTPMVSMLETLAARQPQARVHYVHGARDIASHAMAIMFGSSPRPFPPAATPSSTKPRRRPRTWPPTYVRAEYLVPGWPRRPRRTRPTITCAAPAPSCALWSLNWSPSGCPPIASTMSSSALPTKPWRPEGRPVNACRCQMSSIRRSSNPWCR